MQPKSDELKFVTKNDGYVHIHPSSVNYQGQDGWNVQLTVRFRIHRFSQHRLCSAVALTTEKIKSRGPAWFKAFCSRGQLFLHVAGPGVRNGHNANLVLSLLSLGAWEG